MAAISQVCHPWLRAACLVSLAGLIATAAPSTPASGSGIGRKGRAEVPAMVTVPGGTYRSPFRTSGKERTEWVKPFLLDARPVNGAEFLAFLREQPRWTRSKVKPLFADSGYLASWAADDRPPSRSLQKPVTQVSWYAAKEFCSCRGKRLPTTAEWERAALQVPDGIDSAAYFSRILSWYASPGSTGPSPEDSVASRNAFGLRDMFGGVWEWTSDFNATGSAGRGEVSAKDASFFCGAAAGTAAPGTDYATFMRYAFRLSLKPEFAVGSLGFRCAKDSP